jgi:hypothetical protein
MKAAEKEVEYLEAAAREFANLPTVPTEEGRALSPVEIPPFKVMRKLRKEAAKNKADAERSELEAKVIDLAEQIKEKQRLLKALIEGGSSTLDPVVTPAYTDENEIEDTKDDVEGEGFAGPDGDFVAFPAYDGSEEPTDWKKPFGQYCSRHRKAVKADLTAGQKNDKSYVQSLLNEGWAKLTDDEKDVYRAWADWDRQRYERDKRIFDEQTGSVPKKRKLGV